MHPNYQIPTCNKETPAEKRARLAGEAKTSKAAEAILAKLAPAIMTASSLKDHPNFFLLHEQTTKQFHCALDECLKLQTTCKDIVTSNGQGTLDTDAKAAAETANMLKKTTTLLQQMLGKLSTM